MGLQDIFIPYTKQQIDESDKEAVYAALSSRVITRGEKTVEFEEAIAGYCKSEFAVSFNSGTTALQAAAFAADLNAYDMVITSPNTFIGTIAAAIQKRAFIQLADVEQETGMASIEEMGSIQKSPQSRGKKVVIPVYYGGQSFDIKALDQTVTSPNTIIIEDAAGAFGAMHDREYPVGSCQFSDMCIFSFHPTKSLTTGEGGVVTTNSSAFSEKLREFRNNGIHYPEEFRKTSPWLFESHAATGNFHLTEIQAALGLSQLKRFPEMMQSRRKAVEIYHSQLNEINEIQLMDGFASPLSSPTLFVIRIDFDQCPLNKGELMLRLKEEGIGTQVHYIPLYHHPIYTKSYGEQPPLTHTEAFYREALSLPLYAGITEDVIARVCETLKKLMKR